MINKANTPFLGKFAFFSKSYFGPGPCLQLKTLTAVWKDFIYITAVRVFNC